MTGFDYWKEAVELAAESCQLYLTEEQANDMAEAMNTAHEHYGQAFYTPPSTDRLHAIEAEWSAKLHRLQAEFDNYVNGAERAVKRALRQDSDVIISIDSDGSVYRTCGITEQIL